jgi:transcriptional regulator GlxA family with amidase domain
VKQVPDARIVRSIDEMEQRLSDKLTIAELAASVGLSTSRFAHLFRLTTGLSPVRYLHELRMSRAQDLLQTTTLPVGTVMRRVGWSDPSHFSKAFRRRFGVGPRECRHGRAAAVEPPSQ